MFRLGIGALPFLLPLLLQIGFQSDTVPVRPHHLYGATLGAMFMKAAVAGVLQSLRLPAGAHLQQLISAAFPRRVRELRARHAVRGHGGDIAGRRLLPFAAIHRRSTPSPTPRSNRALMSRATAMIAAAQQLSMSTGVAVGALVVETHAAAQARRDHERRGFSPGFSRRRRACSVRGLIFMRLSPDAGAELRAGKRHRRNRRSAAAARYGKRDRVGWSCQVRAAAKSLASR